MSTPTPTGDGRSVGRSNGHSNGQAGGRSFLEPDQEMLTRLTRLAGQVLGGLATTESPVRRDSLPTDQMLTEAEQDAAAQRLSALAPPAAPSPPTAPVPVATQPGQASYYFVDEAPSSLPAISPEAGPDPAAQAPAWAAAPSSTSPAAPGPGDAVFMVDAVRSDFPMLTERVNGRPLVWLDNAATTHKPQPVIDRLRQFYAHENSNIHRGAHSLATQATDAYEDARAKVADFLGAATADSIVFTRGTTESVNLVAQTWGRANIGPGDEIMISQLEHHANIVPWQLLAEQTGATIKVIPVDEDGELRLDSYLGMLGKRSKMVAVAHVSNVLGTIVPIGPMIAAAHQAGARVLVDGAQAVAHLPVRVGQLDADFYTFSGHKIYGPTGIGALYAKPELLAEMPPWQGGGNMISDVTFERTSYQSGPAKFEAGTGNIADAIGLGAALDYVTQIGLPAICAYEHQLLDYGMRQIAAVPGLRLIGTAPQKASVLTFALDGHDPAEVGEALDREGIEVRSGHHCAQPILRRFGLESAVRPSLAMYNTYAEVDLLVAALSKIAASGGSGKIAASGSRDSRPGPIAYLS
ncbi:MAG TPA: cysteine desulfurase [Streptosporangiaceae bacterium]